jgi:hypothetical protein
MLGSRLLVTGTLLTLGLVACGGSSSSRPSSFARSSLRTRASRAS